MAVSIWMKFQIGGTQNSFEKRPPASPLKMAEIKFPQKTISCPVFVTISINKRVRAFDTIFVERLWRYVNNEDIY